MNTNVLFGEKPVTIEDIVGLAERRASGSLTQNPEFTAKIARGREFLMSLLREKVPVYGVTTGFGDSCERAVEPEIQSQLPVQLVNFHRCGMGKFLDDRQVRAVMAVRLASLVQGKSGVRLEVLKQIETYLAKDLKPLIPEEGSVGASGDLTPMSYLAASLMGLGDVRFDGRTMSCHEALSALKLEPLPLEAKESLSIMNGTSVMTGLACLAFKRAEYLCQLATRITALMSVALKGNAYHFASRLFEAKPFPGQARVAERIFADVENVNDKDPNNRIQDRYSIRCAPHIIGVLEDALPFFRSLIEIEVNSANDNPIIDADHERVFHGGHFYGGHMAFVMDSMKNTVANIADLLDRQVALVVDPKFNNGLPANLSAAQGAMAPINHGLKAVQIAASAWTAEALKQTMPASVFSRSTEAHNQDKVSMGTIAARDCLRVLELTEQVAAAALLAAQQAVMVRGRQGELEATRFNSNVADFLADVETTSPLLVSDRPLDATLRGFVDRIRDRHWGLYT